MYALQKMLAYRNRSKSCPYDNVVVVVVVVKWNLSYILCVQPKKTEINCKEEERKKINNFYVRQKHACLKARWMCQKKCAFLTLYLSHHHQPLFYLLFFILMRRGWIFLFFLFFNYYLFLCSRERTKFSHRCRRWWNFDDAGPWKQDVITCMEWRWWWS